MWGGAGTAPSPQPLQQPGDWSDWFFRRGCCSPSGPSSPAISCPCVAQLPPEQPPGWVSQEAPSTTPTSCGSALHPEVIQGVGGPGSLLCPAGGSMAQGWDRSLGRALGAGNASLPCSPGTWPTTWDWHDPARLPVEPVGSWQPWGAAVGASETIPGCRADWVRSPPRLLGFLAWHALLAAPAFGTRVAGTGMIVTGAAQVAAHLCHLLAAGIGRSCLAMLPRAGASDVPWSPSPPQGAFWGQQLQLETGWRGRRQCKGWLLTIAVSNKAEVLFLLSCLRSTFPCNLGAGGQPNTRQ